MNRWFPLIGLEIHAQLNTKSKLFSNASKKFMATPNSCVARFDASMPGTLPILNRKAVELAVATSYALNCQVALKSSFDRKHYFYADMPQGYQITQQRAPLAKHGFVDYLSESSKMKRVHIHQVQLEQDSGKSLHDEKEGLSLIDLNRAGVGLVEIVTSPDIRSSSDACSFVKEVMKILQYIGSCTCKMEEGEFRVDANVSVSADISVMGTRTEIKNINRFKGIKQAIDYEITRQIKILQEGGKVVNETRGLTNSGETVSMREKESAYDYRFMPDGNLPYLILHTNESIGKAQHKNAINVDEIRSNLPTLPSEYRRRLQNEYPFEKDIIDFMLENKMAEYYLALVAHRPQVDRMLTFDYIRVHLLPYLERKELSFDECPLKSNDLGDLMYMTHSYQIDGSICNKVYQEALDTNKSPVQIIKENGWYKISDETMLSSWLDQVLDEVKQQSPDLLVFPPKRRKLETAVKKLTSHVIGRIAIISDGKAHAKLMRIIVKKRLDMLIDEQREEQKSSGASS